MVLEGKALVVRLNLLLIEGLGDAVLVSLVQGHGIAAKLTSEMPRIS